MFHMYNMYVEIQILLTFTNINYNGKKLRKIYLVDITKYMTPCDKITQHFKQLHQNIVPNQVLCFKMKMGSIY